MENYREILYKQLCYWIGGLILCFALIVLVCLYFHKYKKKNPIEKSIYLILLIPLLCLIFIIYTTIDANMIIKDLRESSFATYTGYYRIEDNGYRGLDFCYLEDNNYQKLRVVTRFSSDEQGYGTVVYGQHSMIVVAVEKG